MPGNTTGTTQAGGDEAHEQGAGRMAVAGTVLAERESLDAGVVDVQEQSTEGELIAPRHRPATRTRERLVERVDESVRERIEQIPDNGLVLFKLGAHAPGHQAQEVAPIGTRGNRQDGQNEGLDDFFEEPTGGHLLQSLGQRTEPRLDVARPLPVDLLIELCFRPEVVADQRERNAGFLGDVPDRNAVKSLVANRRSAARRMLCRRLGASSAALGAPERLRVRVAGGAARGESFVTGMGGFCTVVQFLLNVCTKSI